MLHTGSVAIEFRCDGTPVRRKIIQMGRQGMSVNKERCVRFARTNRRRQIMRMIAFSLVSAGLALFLNSPTAKAGPIIFSGSGSSPAGIQVTVDAFRADLGTLNPNVAGSFGSGRRGINWDAVPDAFAAPNLLPANFFNVNSPRGVVFTTAGTGFQVSANAVNPTNTPVLFGNINSTYPGLFQIFSPQKLFTALGSDVLDVVLSSRGDEGRGPTQTV
jgi:hypothetical protein